MNIIKIEPYDNGAHDNNSSEYIKTVPDGWAKIPEDLDIPNFPFGDIEVEEINGIMTVVKWTPREIPEIEMPEPEPTAEDMLNALMEGMNNE